MRAQATSYLQIVAHRDVTLLGSSAVRRQFNGSAVPRPNDHSAREFFQLPDNKSNPPGIRSFHLGITPHPPIPNPAST